MDQIKNIVFQILNKKLKTYGFTCIGPVPQILNAFQEVHTNEIEFHTFDKHPQRFLEFIFDKYSVPLPYDKKKGGIQSKLFIVQGSKDNKKMHKYFFKAFKLPKSSDPKFKVFIVSNLDDYVDIMPDFFSIMAEFVKEVSKKNMFLLLFQFNKPNSAISTLNLETLEFDSAFASKIVSEPPKSLIDESQEIKEEEAKKTLPMNKELSNKLTKAEAIFQEPEINKEKIETKEALQEFESVLYLVVKSINSDENPSMHSINELGRLFEIIKSASPKDLKKYLEQLNIIQEILITDGEQSAGLSYPIAQLIYKIYKITGDKEARLEFTKRMAQGYASIQLNDYASEFYDLTLAISKSQEDAEITSKFYTNLAEETESDFMKTTYYYRSIAAAYLSQNKTLIDALTPKIEF